MTSRIALIGPDAATLKLFLEEGGYEPELLSGFDIESEDLRRFELFVLSPFREDGIPLYDRFRGILGPRRVPVILMLSENQEELPESFLAGINDIHFHSSPRAALLETVRRQISVPRRRESSSVARVRQAGSASAETSLGCAVNVSLTGLLLEVQREFSVGGAVEVEFFLGDDPTPVSASGIVRRSVFDPERLRRSYGIAFTRISPADRQRLASFCEELP